MRLPLISLFALHRFEMSRFNFKGDIVFLVVIQFISARILDFWAKKVMHELHRQFRRGEMPNSFKRTALCRKMDIAQIHHSI